jgi:hypothetical protein
VDGIIESSLLTQLTPSALAIIAIILVYMLWQRQTQQFSEIMGRIVELQSVVSKSETENRAANAVITEQNTKFQLEIAGTRPSRAEMNESLDRITSAVRDMMNPIRDDLKTIKETLLRGKTGAD